MDSTSSWSGGGQPLSAPPTSEQAHWPGGRDASDAKLQLGWNWSEQSALSETSSLRVVSAMGAGSVLQGGVFAMNLRAGHAGQSLGRLAFGDKHYQHLPRSPVQAYVLASPEGPDREDLPKYDRVAVIEISTTGEVSVNQIDGVVARMQLGLAWLRSTLHELTLHPAVLEASDRVG
eukprot:2276419-Amphidinium_carterae.1